MGVLSARSWTPWYAAGMYPLDQFFGRPAAHMRVADHFVAHATAEQLIDRHAQRLAGNVPQRNVHRGEGAAGDLVVGKEEAVEVLSIEGREVRVTHPGKLYFSKQTKLSKLDLVRYYLSIAPGALAGIRDRPIVLKRFVNGAEGEAFYQKRAPAERPPWLRTVTLSFPSGRTAEEIVVDDAAGLIRDLSDAGALVVGTALNTF